MEHVRSRRNLADIKSDCHELYFTMIRASHLHLRLVVHDWALQAHDRAISEGMQPCTQLLRDQNLDGDFKLEPKSWHPGQ